MDFQQSTQFFSPQLMKCMLVAVARGHSQTAMPTSEHGAALFLLDSHSTSMTAQI